MNAAGVARNLGHSSALSTALLRALTLALWREDHGFARPPHDDWFPAALDYATRPLRSGVRALIPLDDPDPGAENDAGRSEPTGYGLVDYLEQHLARLAALRPIPDRVWEALRTHTTRAEDLLALAHAVKSYSRFGLVGCFYRAAAAAGDPGALSNLASWLSEQREREADAEATWREAAAAGDPYAVRWLASWQSEQPGRDADASATFWEAAAAGDPHALRWLASWLSKRPGREADAEATWRAAAATGDQQAMHELASSLHRRPGRAAEAARISASASTAHDALRPPPRPTEETPVL